MNVLNAIAKVRFASTRPQRVQLAKEEKLAVELLCFEPDQSLDLQAGPRCYYVVTGRAALATGGQQTQLGTGEFAALRGAEPHTVANGGPDRLVCLAVQAA